MGLKISCTIPNPTLPHLAPYFLGAIICAEGSGEVDSLMFINQNQKYSSFLNIELDICSSQLRRLYPTFLQIWNRTGMLVASPNRLGELMQAIGRGHDLSFVEIWGSPIIAFLISGSQ